MHRRRWCHVEVTLKVGLGWRAAVQLDVGHDEGQVLSLQFRKRVLQLSVLPATSLYQPSNGRRSPAAALDARGRLVQRLLDGCHPATQLVRISDRRARKACRR